MPISFHIDGITDSQNKWDRKHWSQREREFWYWLVKEKIGVVEPVKEPRHVHIIRVSTRLIDDQNVPSGCKYLVDAIQAFGHIWRDSRKWARVTFDQRICKPQEKPHMEVIISAPTEEHPGSSA